jgi:hypothetical protein
MDNRRTAKKDEAILTSVAESIGATLGTIAAKAGSVQKALAEKVAGANPRVRRVVREAKAVVKKRAHARGSRVRKARATRATGRTARRSRKKS